MWPNIAYRHGNCNGDSHRFLTDFLENDGWVDAVIEKYDLKDDADATAERKAKNFLNSLWHKNAALAPVSATVTYTAPHTRQEKSVERREIMPHVLGLVRDMRSCVAKMEAGDDYSDMTDSHRDRFSVYCAEMESRVIAQLLQECGNRIMNSSYRNDGVVGLVDENAIPELPSQIDGYTFKVKEIPVHRFGCLGYAMAMLFREDVDYQSYYYLHQLRSMGYSIRKHAPPSKEKKLLHLQLPASGGAGHCVGYDVGEDSLIRKYDVNEGVSIVQRLPSGGMLVEVLINDPSGGLKSLGNYENHRFETTTCKKTRSRLSPALCNSPLRGRFLELSIDCGQDNQHKDRNPPTVEPTGNKGCRGMKSLHNSPALERIAELESGQENKNRDPPASSESNGNLDESMMCASPSQPSPFSKRLSGSRTSRSGSCTCRTSRGWFECRYWIIVF